MDRTEREHDATDPRYVCRRCDRHVSRRGGGLDCPSCGTTVSIVDGIPRFPVPDPADGSSSETVFDRLAPIYETPLWFSPLYRFVGGPAAPWNDRERIAALLDLEDEDATVLDVACGTGRIARYVAPDAASVVGVDISEGMLERANRYAAREGIDDVAFARMSADELWFGADAFDRVTCCWALHLLSDVDAALSEVERVLRPGGRFVGGVLVDEFVFDVPPVRWVARGLLDADPFDIEEFRERLRRAGFSRIEFDRRGAALFFRANVE